MKFTSKGSASTIAGAHVGPGVRGERHGSGSSSSIRRSRFVARALVAVLFTAAFALPQTHGSPWPPPFPWTQVLRGHENGTTPMLTPAHDQTLPPLQGCFTDVTFDFSYTAWIVNPTTSIQTVFLNYTGATVSVDVLDPQGSGIGHVSAPLPSIPVNVPPMTTMGPITATIYGFHIGGQGSLGQTTAFDGPAGTNVQNTVAFPVNFVVVQSGACTVRQHVGFSATVSLAY